MSAMWALKSVGVCVRFHILHTVANSMTCRLAGKGEACVRYSLLLDHGRWKIRKGRFGRKHENEQIGGLTSYFVYLYRIFYLFPPRFSDPFPPRFFEMPRCFFSPLFLPAGIICANPIFPRFKTVLVMFWGRRASKSRIEGTIPAFGA